MTTYLEPSEREAIQRQAVSALVAVVTLVAGVVAFTLWRADGESLGVRLLALSLIPTSVAVGIAIEVRVWPSLLDPEDSEELRDNALAFDLVRRSERLLEDLATQAPGGPSAQIAGLLALYEVHEAKVEAFLTTTVAAEPAAVVELQLLSQRLREHARRHRAMRERSIDLKADLDLREPAPAQAATPRTTKPS